MTMTMTPAHPGFHSAQIKMSLAYEYKAGS